MNTDIILAALHEEIVILNATILTLEINEKTFKLKIVRLQNEIKQLKQQILDMMNLSEQDVKDGSKPSSLNAIRDNHE